MASSWALCILLATNYFAKVSSSVMAGDEKCTAKRGTCKITSEACSGAYFYDSSPICAGAANRQCCRPIGSVDNLCTSRGGSCKYTNVACSGSYNSSPWCDGPASRQCCVPIPASQDAPCTSRSGKCQYTNVACSGHYDSSPLCGGPDNRQCCLPTPTSSTGGAMSSDCLGCICQVEGCKEGSCNMDVGTLSCGPYQIKLPYWIDAGCPGTGKSCSALTYAQQTSGWQSCTKYKSCSVTTIANYMKRYASNCQSNPTCQVYARVHNGGPNGCKNSGTLGYWTKVQTCCNGKHC